jgi:hypothetical protein
MRAGVLLAALLAPWLNAQWAIQYSYTNENETLEFSDLAFPSPDRGIAVGAIRSESGSKRPVAVVTSDGGATWSQVALEEEPVSLFFLTDSQGWMVTDRGIWNTQESGRSWKRISMHDPNSILRVWFIDANRGFAVGRQKRALETRDGGSTWTPIPAAAEPAGNPEFTSYTTIAFADAKRGLIAGSSVPPASLDQQRQVPTLTLQMQTLDGGQSWTSSTAPLFGEVTAMQLAGADGLILFTFNRSFQWPSEVYRLDLRNGRSASAFRDANLRVTSMALFTGRQAFLAGIELPREAIDGANSGRLRILSSTDLLEWKPMQVDYRALGRRAWLSGPDAQHLWAATDSGMILRLER